MVTTLKPSESSITAPAEAIALDTFLQNPGKRQEWVDGHLIERQDMTAKTGRIQARLARYWGNYQESSAQGGEVYTETSCRTVNRVRCPDVAYLPPELVKQFGDFKVLPQSFPLVAEVISPNDEAEEVFTKVREYLESSCQEVWLIFPDSRWVMIITTDQQVLLGPEDIAKAQKMLSGFKIPVSDLIA